jgi:hypothetical protein
MGEGECQATCPKTQRLLGKYRQSDPDFSILDLKAYFHGYRYVSETIEMLPHKPDDIFITQLFQKIVASGCVHPAKRLLLHYNGIGMKKRMTNFHEYDVVRVTQLIQPDRHYDGNEDIKRPQQVGDQGTIVHIPPEADSWCIVECRRCYELLK